jgi:hypothetical protein
MRNGTLYGGDAEAGEVVGEVEGLEEGSKIGDQIWGDTTEGGENVNQGTVRNACVVV